MRKPPSLLHQLSQAAREEASDDKTRLDERWDRLAAGKLSEAENDELLGLADASGDAREAYQAFRQLGPAFEKGVVAAILARQEAEAEVAAASTAGEPPRALAELARRPLPPGSGSRRPYFFFGSLGSTLAAVAAAFFFFYVPPMSFYTLEDPTGFARTRSAVEPSGQPENPPAYANGDPLDLAATASVKPGKGLDARLFFVGADDPRLHETTIHPSILKDGTELHFSATLGKNLVLPYGISKLVVVIARPGKFPDQETILKAVRIDGQPETYWQVLVQEIELEKDE